jgi:hypothetical protein
MKKVYSIIVLVLSVSTVAWSLQDSKLDKNPMSARHQRFKASRQTQQFPLHAPAAAAAESMHNGSQQSPSRSVTTCWFFLIASILLECLDTTVSKLARDQESTLLFFFACSLNLIR